MCSGEQEVSVITIPTWQGLFPTTQLHFLHPWKSAWVITVAWMQPVESSLERRPRVMHGAITEGRSTNYVWNIIERTTCGLKSKLQEVIYNLTQTIRLPIRDYSGHPSPPPTAVLRTFNFAPGKISAAPKNGSVTASCVTLITYIPVGIAMTSCIRLRNNVAYRAS